MSLQWCLFYTTGHSRSRPTGYTTREMYHVCAIWLYLSEDACLTSNSMCVRGAVQVVPKKESVHQTIKRWAVPAHLMLAVRPACVSCCARCVPRARCCPGTPCQQLAVINWLRVFSIAQLVFVSQLYINLQQHLQAICLWKPMPMHSPGCMPAAGTVMQQQSRLQVSLLLYKPVCAPAVPHCGTAACAGPPAQPEHLLTDSWSNKHLHSRTCG